MTTSSVVKCPCCGKLKSLEPFQTIGSHEFLIIDISLDIMTRVTFAGSESVFRDVLNHPVQFHSRVLVQNDANTAIAGQTFASLRTFVLQNSANIPFGLSVFRGCPNSFVFREFSATEDSQTLISGMAQVSFALRVVLVRFVRHHHSHVLPVQRIRFGKYHVLDANPLLQRIHCEHHKHSDHFCRQLLPAKPLWPLFSTILPDIFKTCHIRCDHRSRANREIHQTVSVRLFGVLYRRPFLRFHAPSIQFHGIPSLHHRLFDTKHYLRIGVGRILSAVGSVGSVLCENSDYFAGSNSGTGFLLANSIKHFSARIESSPQIADHGRRTEN